MKILILLFLTTIFLKSQQFPTDTLTWNASSEHCVNFVFLGDGYLESQQDKFISDVERFSAELFAQAPYRQYQNLFNVIAIKVPSNEEGASKPNVGEVDNVFGSTYGYAGIDRLLVPRNQSLIYNIVNENFPVYDQIFLIVNDLKYGGSGGNIATAANSQISGEIAIHEIGHSFSALADEYWAGNQFAYEQPNMTMDPNPETVKWNMWVGKGGTGVFEYGGDGFGWYRPHQSCKMQMLGRPFCLVCLEKQTYDILSYSEPLLGYYPEKSTVEIENEMNFVADLLLPSDGFYTIDWKLDNVDIASTSNTITLKNEDIGEKGSSLEFTIDYANRFIENPVYQIGKVYSKSWFINKGTTNSLEDNFDLSFDYQIYPNPSSDYLTVKLEAKETIKHAKIRLLDLNGDDLYSVELNHKLDINHNINVKEFASGNYFLNIILDCKQITKNIVIQ
jgi:hypothetical protein